jgi:tRNA(Ile)-lysidine synthase
MLAALAGLRDRFDIHCLHVEHGIRPAAESRGDADAVEALCAEFGIPCTVVSIAPGKIERTAKRRGIGLEAAARLYRHKAWNTEARRVGAAKVLVAHTRDDLLETALMRILRGSGPAGLAAMPRSRGRIQRPLLDRSRSEVLAYLTARGIPYRTDSTNADPAFLRNRIRHKLIPCLDEFFPGWRRTLPDLAETQRMAADFLAAEAAGRIPWTGEDRVWSVSSERFFSQPPILREEALFAVLDGSGTPLPGGKPPRRRSLRLFAQGEVGSLDLGFAILRRDAKRVVFGLRRQDGENGFSLLIKGPGIYKLKGLTIRVFRKETALPMEAGERRSFDQRSIGFFAELPLVLRQHYPGDYLFRGGRKRRVTECIRGTGIRTSGLITAEDRRGTAAFIGREGDGFSIVLTRETENRENHLFFSI